MKLVVALGNPGSKYEYTRHNAAWLVVDEIFGIENYQRDKYGDFEWKEISHNDKSLVLVKPHTYMNKSGLATQYALKRFEVTIPDLLVVHDEYDLPLGEWRIQDNRGPAGHNGVKSIIDALGTKDFRRLRIGVRPTDISASIKADQIVLQEFTEIELGKLKEISQNIASKL